MTSHYLPFDAFASVDPSKQQPLDFLSFQPNADVLAPHPDLFESELDSSLAAFDPSQLQLLPPLDHSDAFAFLRSDTPTCGPPSTITVSSESASAYESISSQSDAYFSYTPTNYSLPLDLDMDFGRVRLNAMSEYHSIAAVQKTASGMSAMNPQDYGSASPESESQSDEHDAMSFGALPPASPLNPAGSVYSDYGSDYYPAVPSHGSLAYSRSTVAPHNIAHPQAHRQAPAHVVGRPPSPVGAGLNIPLLYPVSRGSRPVGSSHVSGNSSDEGSNSGHNDNDPRRKYRCSQCPRAFARAYNLKTHMATHDPNRPKPHVCPHPSCSRSFSRKHDLGRHLVSIHRDEPAAAGLESRVGLAGLKDGRTWCESCGKSSSKDMKGCDCEE